MVKYDPADINYSSLPHLLSSLLDKRKITPGQLAQAIDCKLDIIENWLTGNAVPCIQTCRKLADFGGLSLTRILSLTNHLPALIQNERIELIEFRKNDDANSYEYLDEDLNTMIEDLIEHDIIKERYEPANDFAE
jgi:hypothetical protein